MAKVQHFDSIALAAVVHELSDLREARIDKVGQPSGHELYLNLRAGGQNRRLYINLRDQWARMHLTTATLPNLPVPYAFTMQLRKYLEGSRLLRVEQPGLERVVHLVVAGRDELGDPFERVLVVELIGKYSNLFLLDNREQVLGCLRPVTEAMCEVRQLGPGLPYAPPPVAEGKVPFLEADATTFCAALEGGGHVTDRLNERIAGLSKVALGQLLASLGLSPRVAVDELEALEPLLARLALAQSDLRAGRFSPRMEAGAAWSYNLWALDRPVAGGASALLDRYYSSLEARFILDERRRVLRVALGELLRKQRGRVKEWEQSREKAESAERYRELGDLITSHMYAIAPGATAVEVTDFYSPEQPTLTLTLDPQLTASENAQRYFRKYQKARNSREALDRLLEGAREELAYLEQVAIAVEQATETADLQEVAEEIATLTGQSAPKGRLETPKPLQLTSSDGLVILVGKNNRQNDYVTFKMAHAGDLWLHTQNIPGSHVVIRADGEVPERTLHEAAALAAYYSQARQSSQVPVVVTRRKFVKKPRGAKPGMVVYEQEQTLYVNPGESLVEMPELVGETASP
ncbi:MAG TPA: NFACT RNA binding domain-containing protein [Oscillatoriaceae cyanobacterium]